ncbi:MAG: hypothetical protein QOJ73_7182 [Streptosporangiaceae bacterium]|jgi:hypothetical protein|nr:hypothetical protein [Streptosporangiaceae bacterium]
MKPFPERMLGAEAPQLSDYFDLVTQMQVGANAYVQCLQLHLCQPRDFPLC